MSDGLDMLGAETIKAAGPLTWKRSVLAVLAGAVGAVVVPKHPVLAFLGTAAAASNVHAVATGDRKWKDAVRLMGRHVVATVGSLSVPKYPAMGYIAGAVAADLLIDGEGGGIIEGWGEYEGIRSSRKVVDAVVVDETSKALVKQ